MTSSLHNATARDADGPSVQVACPTCETITRCAVGGDAPQVDASWRCPHCEVETPGGTSPVAGQSVDRCWVCGCEEFYIQKDFNRRLGLTIVLFSFGIIFVVMLTAGHLAGIYLLFGLALIDWVIYQLLRNVTVCYLCHTIYRGFPQNPNHVGFYLGNEEKYKKLRQDWLSRLEPEGPQ